MLRSRDLLEYERRFSTNPTGQGGRIAVGEIGSMLRQPLKSLGEKDLRVSCFRLLGCFGLGPRMRRASQPVGRRHHWLHRDEVL